MALSPLRWVVAAALGCAAIWFGFVNRAGRKPALRPQVAQAMTAEAATYTATLGTLRQATDRLRLVTIRDSVLALANKRPTPGLDVYVSDAFGPAGRQLDSLLRQRYAQNAGRSRARVIAVAVMDSAQFERGQPRPRPSWGLPIHAFIPQSGADVPCVAIVRIPLPLSGAPVPAYAARNMSSRETIGAILSACTYYAAFGAPGHAVAEWLRGSNWRLARIADWNDQPQVFKPRWAGEVPLYVRALYSGFVDESWEVRTMLSTTGVRCLAEHSGKCAEAAMSGRVVSGDSAWRSSVVALTGTNQARFFLPRDAQALGPSDEWILSEMVRTLGPEKFGQFWRSTEPVERAFASAAGQSLDEWIGGWARRIYGPMETGPKLPMSGVVTGILFLVLGFGVSAAISNRRRVA